jgi:hypothetical protein
MGFPAISTGSAQLSEYQAKLIKRELDEVIIFYDDDKAGDNAVWGFTKQNGDYQPGIVTALEPFVTLRKVGKHKLDPNALMVLERSGEVRRLIERAKPTWKLRNPNNPL